LNIFILFDSFVYIKMTDTSIDIIPKDIYVSEDEIVIVVPL